MSHSIPQFRYDGKNILKLIDQYFSSGTDFSRFEMDLFTEMMRLGTEIIKYVLEETDESIRSSIFRGKNWNVVRTDTKELLTVFGEVQYQKTYYRNRTDGRHACLLDKMLGFSPDMRMTDAAKVRILREAEQTSYRKGGEEASMLDQVSKQTVKGLVHSLEFPSEHEKEPLKELRKADYLYIDADEDHVALQYLLKKGDLVLNEYGGKNNCVMPKLVYVYEGIKKDPKSGKWYLINPHYFSGVYDGKENAVLWDEIQTYLEHTYDLEHVKRIYLNGDGAQWIRGGKNYIAGMTFVLDEFHMDEYLTKITSHLGETAESARRQLKDEIKSGTKENFRALVEQAADSAEEGRREKIQSFGEYILGNWTAAVLRLNERDKVYGCSAEGHVSHVLSSRMSSRPMGWSRRGADRMARLRAYAYNNGDMLELVRYQKKYHRDVLQKAAGAETDKVLSAEEVNRCSRNIGSEFGRYYENIQVHLSDRIGKHVLSGLHSYMWKLQ